GYPEAGMTPPRGSERRLRYAVCRAVVASCALVGGCAPERPPRDRDVSSLSAIPAPPEPLDSRADPARGEAWLSPLPSLVALDLAGPACRTSVTLKRQEQGDPAILYAVTVLPRDVGQLKTRLRDEAGRRGFSTAEGEYGFLVHGREGSVEL